MKPGTIITTFKSKKGREVLFRYPLGDDLDAMLTYANALVDEDTYLALCRRISREDEEAFLKKSIADIKKRELVKIVVLVNNVFAGIGDVRRQSGRKYHVGEIGISLGKEFREEGIGSVLLETLIAQAKILGLKLLTLTCFETNGRALHVYEKMGFIRVGMIPDAIYYQKNYIGEVHLYLPLASL